MGTVTGMRIFTERTLRGYWEQHAAVGPSLRAWLKHTEQANWSSPQQVKDDYPSASIISNNRVVFNLKGNNYRLVVQINYLKGRVYIRFIGTHAEYDRINAAEV